MSNSEVIMPKMGESLTEGTIVRWFREAGEEIAEGEPLLEITTEKVEVEIEAPASGVVTEIRFDAGARVPIDTVIAVIASDTSNASATDSSASNGGSSHVRSNQEAESSPRPEPVQVSAPQPVQTGANGVSTVETQRERKRMMLRRSSPLVRKMAADHGVDVGLIKGTGANGRVTARDLEDFLREREKTTLPTAGAPRPLVQGGFASDQPEIMPISPMRKAIADNLLRSIRTIPHAYTVHEMDFTRLEARRSHFKNLFRDKYSLKLTPLVLLIHACAKALIEVPAVNASWKQDRIEANRTANIGIAIAVKDGLLVPTLKRVEQMTLKEIAEGVDRLAQRARSGQLRPDDLRGGTFSISSPGALGALFATPIINQQQGAILHFGAIHKVPAVVSDIDGNDVIAIRQHAMLTLGIDHRLVDGWEADTFMAALRKRVENPELDMYKECGL